MAADILILKKRGERIEVKITNKMRGGYSHPSYSIVVNLKNYKDLALFLHDLNDLMDAPVGKAIIEYQKEKAKGWPF